jgi:zinc/manganese transport system substrate-binding protein
MSFSGADMNTRILVSLFNALLILLAASPAQAALRVFACEPDWASLTEELAGDHAEVFAATSAHQDVHYIQAKPSLIAQVRRADLLVCTGAELESGWLPALLRRSGNPAVQRGGRGYFEASEHVAMLEIPQRLDRAEGDVHAKGNPHIQLDPGNIQRVATALTARLIEIDAEHTADYRRQLEDFERRWGAAQKRWSQQAEPLRNMAVVVHHNSWVYLNHWLGLNQVATLEPKPGIPPTSRHLSALLGQLERTPARAAIRSPYQDKRASMWLHKQTGIAAIELPYTVGGNAGARDLFGLFDSTLELLLKVQQ